MKIALVLILAAGTFAAGVYVGRLSLPGPTHDPATSSKDLKVPDFRVVMRDGGTIEVVDSKVRVSAPR